MAEQGDYQDGIRPKHRNREHQVKPEQVHCGLHKASCVLVEVIEIQNAEPHLIFQQGPLNKQNADSRMRVPFTEQVPDTESSKRLIYQQNQGNLESLIVVGYRS